MAIKFELLNDPVVSDFRRTPSSWSKIYEEKLQRLRERPGGTDNPRTPARAYGWPGSVLLDVDDDGDLDVFVPTGPGQDHALFINKLTEEGNLRFALNCGNQTCAALYGLAFRELDGNGVCSGDIDNDGDQVTQGVKANPRRRKRGDGTTSSPRL